MLQSESERDALLHRQIIVFFINLLQHGGYYMYHLRYHIENQHYAHTVYFCVSYGFHNKQGLFPLNIINRLVFLAET
jgi:hypothetical protein